jgi:hypothetical protein
MRMLVAVVMATFIAGAVAPAEAKVLVTINKSTQRVTVAVDGEPRYAWAVSTGRAGRDTPSGTYRAFRMEKDHYSKEWDDAPMPHSIFFTQTGHAIHGSFETAKIGSPASAGCVRLAPENAEKLFALVEEHGVLNTTVEVTGDLRVALARGKPLVASEDDDVRPRGYGTTPRYEELARPRYRDAPGPYYAQPAPYPYGQSPYYRGLPPGYFYEPQPYPRHYRW